MAAMTLSPTPTENDRRSLVESILASDRFVRSKRLSDFLHCVVEAELAGEADLITEQFVGQRVYGKAPGYNASEENVVRVDARRLRSALRAYFAEEGEAQEWTLEIPKGHYAPRYRRRDGATPAPSPPETEPRASPVPWSRIAVGVAAGILLGLALGAALREGAVPDAPAADAKATRHWLWPALFSGGQETYIVLPDSLFAAVQDISGRTFTLRDYQSPGFPSGDAFDGTGLPSEDVARIISRRQYTGVGDSSVAARLLRLAPEPFSAVSLHFARNMHTRDFKGRNLVLLGSPRSNPWRELFAAQLNFSFGFDDDLHQPYVLNKHPRQGEQSRYAAGDEGSESVYALISCVRNLTNDGYVLMIAGTLMEGTEAAGEFLLSPANTEVLIERLGLSPSEPLRTFEILLESSRMEGTSRGTRIVAHRVGDPLKRFAKQN